MSVFFIILLALWALVIFRSFRRGFVKSALSVLFFFIFIFAVRTFSPMTEDLLSESENVQTWAMEQSRNYVGDKIDKSLETGSWSWLENVELPAEAQTAINMMGTTQMSAVVDYVGRDTIVEAAAQTVSPLLIRILSYLITAAVSFVILFAVDLLVGRLARGKEFAGVNRFLGVVVGVVKCLLYTWAIFMLADLLSFTGLGSGILSDIAANPLLQVISSINPLPDLIGQALIKLL